MLTPDILRPALEELFGVSFDTIVNTLTQAQETNTQFQELAPVIRETWRSKEEAQLRESWGEQYEPVYQYLADEVFPKLPAHEQSLYNNAAGLQVLAQRYRPQIEQHIQSAAQPATPEPTTPPETPVPARGTAPAPAPVRYRQSDILRLSEADYEAQRPSIEQAFASGAVEFDIQ